MCGFNLVNKHEKIKQKLCICARSQARDTNLFICCLFYTETHTHKDIFVYKPRSSIILANVTWLNCLWIHMMSIYRFSSACLLYSLLIYFPSLYRSFSFVCPFLWHHCFFNKCRLSLLDVLCCVCLDSFAGVWCACVFMCANLLPELIHCIVIPHVQYMSCYIHCIHCICISNSNSLMRKIVL